MSRLSYPWKNDTDQHNYRSRRQGLLCSDSGFLASSWISDAKRWAGGNATLERYFEMAARSITTVWTPQTAGSSSITSLCDYANRQWAGQVTWTG